MAFVFHLFLKVTSKVKFCICVIVMYYFSLLVLKDKNYTIDGKLIQLGAIQLVWDLRVVDTFLYNLSILHISFKNLIQD